MVHAGIKTLTDAGIEVVVGCEGEARIIFRARFLRGLMASPSLSHSGCVDVFAIASSCVPHQASRAINEEFLSRLASEAAAADKSGQKK